MKMFVYVPTEEGQSWEQVGVVMGGSIYRIFGVTTVQIADLAWENITPVIRWKTSGTGTPCIILPEGVNSDLVPVPPPEPAIPVPPPNPAK